MKERDAGPLPLRRGGLPHNVPVSRRSFLHSSVGAAGLLTGLDRFLPGYASHAGVGAAPTAEAAERVFDLVIGRVSLGFGGRTARATAINGTVPGPLLRFTEGDDAVLRVTNDLDEDTSIHWHGILLPFGMDGVPGVSFDGIAPGTTFEYRYPIRQTGTYWYHSHSGFQEQTGVYGPIIIDPAGGDPNPYDREHVIMLGDWTFENPHDVLRKLRKYPGYYNEGRRTLLDLFGGRPDRGLGSELADRLAWGRMRMDPTDLADVTGATYTYLMNGRAPDDNWTGLFTPGERVRLRFINAGAATYFDVRIPGLAMTVVQADGQDVQPVTVDEIRLAIAETYDVIVTPHEDRAYTVFAESFDRSGYARGTLAPLQGMSAPIPERRKRPLRTMADMGMDHAGMQMEPDRAADAGAPAGAADAPGVGHTGPEHGAAHEMAMPGAGGALAAPGSIPAAVPHGSDSHGPGNAAVPMQTRSRLHEPGVGLGGDGRRVLLYTDLRAPAPAHHLVAPEREIELHLTGNMERYMWSFDGKEYTDRVEPLPLRLGERTRVTFVNDTMMEHPIHLHGMWMELENGSGAYIPRKHTVNVKPAERLSVLVTPDAPGPWALHCHILYHLDMGMFRVVRVSSPTGGGAE